MAERKDGTGEGKVMEKTTDRNEKREEKHKDQK